MKTASRIAYEVVNEYAGPSAYQVMMTTDALRALIMKAIESDRRQQITE